MKECCDRLTKLQITRNTKPVIHYVFKIDQGLLTQVVVFFPRSFVFDAERQSSLILCHFPVDGDLVKISAAIKNMVNSMGEEDFLSAKPLVIDNGTGISKNGFAGEDQPRSVFPKVKNKI